MRESELLTQLDAVGAIITDSHFVYTSGQHGSSYINKDAIYPHTGLVSALCEAIAQYFSHLTIDCVAGPAMGGIILAQWTAHHSTIRNPEPPQAIYAEREGSGSEDGYIFRRGYNKFVSGNRVLVVEDILTTGGSVRKVVEAVRKLGGEIVGVGAICNRGNVTTEDVGNVPELFSLLRLDFESWPAPECPLCQAGRPINTELGHGQ